ncbi:MAG: hypothetical protein Ta2B_00340 [Termitinemataceae bacterium]|nr:MAG: hypothetical protein Ta2B_00340 [Termitinemataceae bacterium]
MKKKIVVCSMLLFVFALAQSFSLGIGLRGSGGYPYYGGGLLISPGDDPSAGWNFGVNYYAGTTSFHVGVTGDYGLLEKTITSVGKGELDFYLGAGFFAYANMDNDDHFGFGLGGRVPIGVDLNFKVVDLYVEVAPQIGINFLPSIGLGGDWFNAAIGFRFWF